MKTFIADKMKRAIEDGCRDIWVFRKVNPLSEMSNHITHMTVDVYQKSKQPCKVNFYDPIDDMAPEINEELMNVHRSNRELVIQQCWLKLLNSIRAILHQNMQLPIL